MKLKLRKRIYYANGVTDAAKVPSMRRDRETLRQAVYLAVLDELTEHGYANTTIEGVAARAGAAKTSVYRYWPTKEELVLDTLRHSLPQADQAPGTGNIRNDLLVMLRQIRQSLDGPGAAVLASLMGERRRHPRLATAVVDKIIKPRQQLMLDALHQAAARGEIPVGAVSLIPVLAAVGLMLLHYFQHGIAPSDQDMADYVDRAILPMLGAQSRA